MQKKWHLSAVFADPRATVAADGKVHPSMFLVQPSTVQYGEIMASYAVEKLGLKKIAIFNDQSNAYAVSLVAPFKAYAQSVGGTIVAEEIYSKGDKDFKTQLDKIKNSGAGCCLCSQLHTGIDHYSETNETAWTENTVFRGVGLCSSVCNDAQRS